MPVKKKVKDYKIVLGSLFGDEGKGRTVNWLTKKAVKDKKKVVVVRYSGGPQAGHTVNEAHNITHIFSTYGSGSLNGADTYLDAMFMFDPISFILERDALLVDMTKANNYRDKNLHLNEPKVWIHKRCRIITPYDVMYGRGDNEVTTNGTCGKGLYATFKRYSEEFGISPKLAFLNHKNDIEHIFENPKEYLDNVKGYYSDFIYKNVSQGYVDEYDKMFFDAIEKINNLIKQDLIKIREEDFRRSGLYDVVIYEGSQGLLLDMDHGFMPNCTPSEVGFNGIPRTITNNPDTEVYLAMRTYLTRHGNGYDPKDEDDKHDLPDYMYNNFRDIIKDSFTNENMKETNVYNEFQKEFKYGMFNIDLLNRAVDRHCLDNYKCKFNLVITHADVLKHVLDEFGQYPYIFNNTVENAYSTIGFKDDIVKNIRLKIDKAYLGDNLAIMYY